MDRRSAVCLTLYRRLARAFQHEFRLVYGEDLDRLGEDAIPEISRRCGLPGLLQLLVDLAMRLPAMFLREMRQDVIYGLRLPVKSTGFTAVALISLSLGIAVASAAFSIMNGQLLRDVPAGNRLRNQASNRFSAQDQRGRCCLYC
jgi:hypothetical protein